MGPRLVVGCDGPVDPLPVIACRIERRLNWPVGGALLLLPPGVAVPARGAAVRCDASGAHAVQRVFSGHVHAVSRGPTGTLLDCQEPARALAGGHRDASWEATTADAVVRELAAAADVPVGDLAPGAALPQFTMLRERSPLAHCLQLAELSGCDCWTDADGRLQMRPPLPAPGALVLDAARATARLAAEQAGTPPAARVVGAGALGSAGPGTERWPVREPPAAGPADAACRLADAAITGLADAERAQQGRARRLAESAAHLDLTLAEVLALDLHQVVTVAGLAGVNGPARVGALGLRSDGVHGLRLDLRLWRLGP
jgi:hypothetical protein